MADVIIRLASIEFIVKVCWPKLSIDASLYMTSVLSRSGYIRGVGEVTRVCVTWRHLFQASIPANMHYERVAVERDTMYTSHHQFTQVSAQS